MSPAHILLDRLLILSRAGSRSSSRRRTSKFLPNLDILRRCFRPETDCPSFPQLDGYTFTVIPPVSANAPGKRSSNANPRSNTRPNESAHADSPSRSSLKHSSSASPHPLTRSRLVKKVRIQESHSPATSLPPHAGTSRLRSLSDQSHLPPPPVTNIARTEEVLLYWDDELGMHAVRRIWIIAEDEK